MDAKWEFIDVGSLATEIEDPDLWVRNTTVESRFRIRLYISAMAGGTGQMQSSLCSCSSDNISRDVGPS